MSGSNSNYRAAIDAIRQYTQATPRIALSSDQGWVCWQRS